MDNSTTLYLSSLRLSTNQIAKFQVSSVLSRCCNMIKAIIRAMHVTPVRTYHEVTCETIHGSADPFYYETSESWRGRISICILQTP